MTWFEHSPATHIYWPAEAPASFKRRLGGRYCGIRFEKSYLPLGVHRRLGRRTRARTLLAPVGRPSELLDDYHRHKHASIRKLKLLPKGMADPEEDCECKSGSDAGHNTQRVEWQIVPPAPSKHEGHSDCNSQHHYNRSGKVSRGFG
jgi:hypothetical protein